VINASLTLLALIIGFSFSMAVTRYDQRKANEQAETDAIAIEYAREELLPPADEARIRQMLVKYLDECELFYMNRDSRQLQANDADTEKLQAEMWSAVLRAAPVQSAPLAALVISGMNTVSSSQGFTQAAWRNRIPLGAWIHY
jgi:hypothetical protein